MVVQLDGRGSSDPDGDPLSYAWSQTSGPSVTFSNSTSAVPLIDTPEVEVETEAMFELVVSDGEESAPSEVTVTILPREAIPGDTMSIE